MPTESADEGPLSIAVSREPTGVPVVAVTGELDVASVDDLRAVLLEPGLPSPDLIIDLCAVTFIDSMGLSSLVAARREVTKHGGTVQIRCTPGPVARVLALTRLTEVFDVAIATDRVDETDGIDETDRRAALDRTTRRPSA